MYSKGAIYEVRTGNFLSSLVSRKTTNFRFVDLCNIMKICVNTLRIFRRGPQIPGHQAIYYLSKLDGF